jgi:hypothetical protein
MECRPTVHHTVLQQQSVHRGRNNFVHGPQMQARHGVPHAHRRIPGADYEHASGALLRRLQHQHAVPRDSVLELDLALLKQTFVQGRGLARRRFQTLSEYRIKLPFLVPMKTQLHAGSKHCTNSPKLIMRSSVRLSYRYSRICVSNEPTNRWSFLVFGVVHVDSAVMGQSETCKVAVMAPSLAFMKKMLPLSDAASMVFSMV